MKTRARTRGEREQRNQKNQTYPPTETKHPQQVRRPPLQCKCHKSSDGRCLQLCKMIARLVTKDEHLVAFSGKSMSGYQQSPVEIN